jgi:hypothetical protein
MQWPVLVGRHAHVRNQHHEIISLAAHGKVVVPGAPTGHLLVHFTVGPLYSTRLYPVQSHAGRKVFRLALRALDDTLHVQFSFTGMMPVFDLP